MAWAELALLGWLAAAIGVLAQAPGFKPVRMDTNREAWICLDSVTGLNYRVEFSTNLAHWQPLVTLQSTGAHQHADSAAPFEALRFYRSREAESNALTGDYLATTNGDVIIHPFTHASVLFWWNNLAIYADPTNTTLAAKGLPKADLILITHGHSDHYNTNALQNLTNSNTVILAPSAVHSAMPAALKSLTTILTNGASTNLLGLKVDAVPSYNFTGSNHPKGVGNGYILTIGGKRLFLSGDTDDTPELLALSDLDVAFIGMRPPFSMNITNAAAAVRVMRPRVVYPNHYLGNDVVRFKQLVGQDLPIEVRLRNWY